MNDHAMNRLLDIMARLRDPRDGCPWDREQTLLSIVPHTLEEAYEVADAIERGDHADLVDELGDLLFQIVFYARIAEEQGLFAFADVAAAIADKLERRHPHVFADARVADAAAQSAAWEAHKQREREARAGNGAPGTLAGIGRALPALTRAVKLQRRAARVGFDWAHIEPVWCKVEEELAELRAAAADPARDPRRVEDEMGDVLFACVNLARHAGVDPEGALRRTNTKFEQRFGYIEARLRDAGVRIEDAGAEQMELLWEEAKRRE
ncbi:MAG: nucleoside triphosphate pyrophosphohydrolase [Gammaproteobacteria bacterium]|nr:nucleoside triphosphate pyrophosphohydrolase [Gammaproteobacteria bacterium]